MPETSKTIQEQFAYSTLFSHSYRPIRLRNQQYLFLPMLKTSLLQNPKPPLPILDRITCSFSLDIPTHFSSEEPAELFPCSPQTTHLLLQKITQYGKKRASLIHNKEIEVFFF